MLGAIASNVLIITALVCSIIAAVNSEWLQTPDNTAQIAMYRYCGLSADDTCSPDIWFFSANAFPTNDIKTAALLWALGICALFVSAVLGFFVMCFNCCCLCCISLPLAVIAGIVLLAATGLFTASLCMYATQFPYLVQLPSMAPFCPNSSSFGRGDCQLEWAFYLAVAVPFMCLLATVAMMPMCTCIGKKVAKSMV